MCPATLRLALWPHNKKVLGSVLSQGVFPPVSVWVPSVYIKVN